MKRARIAEATVHRRRIVELTVELFRNPDFPEGFCMALEDTTLVNKGDVIAVYLDSEHPYDFIALPCFNQLVLNLPSKEEFLRRTGLDSMDALTPEAEHAFWKEFVFEFAEEADGIKLIWE
jgi:hypothetical protein